MQHTGCFYLLTPQKWAHIAVVGLGVSLCSVPAYISISPWIGVGVAISVIAACHIVYTSSVSLPIPQTAILMACLYYLIVPMVSFYFPPADPLYAIGRNAPEYYRYAALSVVGLSLGWCSPLISLKPMQFNEFSAAAGRRVSGVLDLLIAGGLVAILLFRFAPIPTSLRGALYVVAGVRFVGLIGWALLGRRGWMPRLISLLVLELIFATSEGFFLEMMIWSLNIGVVLVFRLKLAREKVVILIALLCLLLPSVQFAKWQLRNATQSPRQQMEVFGLEFGVSPLSKAPLFVISVAEGVFRMMTFQVDEDFISEQCIRYNQGWIVASIIRFVPAVEPYAEGETVKEAVIAALMPRIVMSNKAIAGGAGTFTRFTGHRLNAQTSMNLGMVGEMYANFGFWGGILGCYAYGFLLACFYRFFVRRSRERPLILAFLPFVLIWAVLCETGLAEVFNSVTKAFIVAMAVTHFMPEFVMRKHLLIRQSH